MINSTSKYYCSPDNNNTKGTCLSKITLIKMIIAWNTANASNIIIYNKNYSIEKLWNLLNDKMKNICKDGNDLCWYDSLIKISKDSTVKRNIETLKKKELKPVKPIEWNKNPHEWLSNFDIEKVMFQYQNNKSFKYVFLGVFPIDFAMKNSSNKCLYSQFCNIDIRKYINYKKKFIGLITNLDKHDQPGSHWTSIFIVIDPKLKSYGAYYYDSTSRNIPIYILNFLKEIKSQLTDIYPKHSFNFFYNKKQHQHSNTECGVFSITFQIRWLNLLKKNKNTVFNDIVGNPYMNDKSMYLMRDYLFRPNSN